MAEIKANINTQDLIKLAKLLNATPAYKDGIKLAAADVKAWINVYPPGSEANQAGPYPKKWYIRGTGSYWALKDGGVHSNRKSETLGRRWTTQTTDNGMGAIVGNNVSYAPFVQDADEQPAYHKARGWKTIQDAAKAKIKDVAEIIKTAILEYWKKNGAR